MRSNSVVRNTTPDPSANINRCASMNISASPRTKSAPLPISNALRSMIRLGLDNDGGAVGHDLAHRAADLGRIEAHHHHCVRAHRGRVRHHAVDGLTPRL